MVAAFEHFELSAPTVLDLAAGTGRLTRELLALTPSVIAVEPVDGMRAHIRDAQTLVGTAEDIPVEDGSVDAVFVGEAFHWFDQPVALKEIARVLRPGGGLAVMWNVGQPQEEQQPWRNEIVELVKDIYFHPEGRRVPSAAGNNWREQTEWQRGPGWELFEPLERRQFDHVQRMTADDYVTFVSSWSFVGVMEEPARAELLDSVRAVLDRHGIEAFDQNWRTDCYLTRRREGSDP